LRRPRSRVAVPGRSPGSVFSAQPTHDAEINREGTGLTGEFDPIHDWLTEHVHQHGARYRTDDLVREATGESFTADHFLDYVDEKYRALYDC
jgi:carboxypeptidase Taq